jgi:hypothetical protein
VVAVLTHKMAAVLTVALVAPAVVVELRARLGGARAARWLALAISCRPQRNPHGVNDPLASRVKPL